MLKSVSIFSPPVSLVLLLVLWNCPAVLSSRALLVIDVQNCFLGNGSLAVKDGEAIIPVINRIRQNYGHYFSLVVFTQDWHCVNHVSFASAHSNRKLYETINLTYLSTGQLCESESTRTSYTVNCTTHVEDTIVLQQKLWPDHCIKDTVDAEVHKDLKLEHTDVFIHKGQHCEVDSYSGFVDNGGFDHTALNDKLRERGIHTVFLVGLTLEYCLSDSAVEAQKHGYNTYVVLDATAMIDISNLKAAEKKMTDSGIKLINSKDLGHILRSAAPGKLESQCAALICIFLVINHF